MKIIRTERKPGCYHQWFEVHCAGGLRFLIHKHQASTYEEAIEYFYNHCEEWNENLFPLYVCNAEPIPDSIALAS